MEKIQTNQRKRIEDLFKLLKQRLNMKEIHKYIRYEKYHL